MLRHLGVAALCRLVLIALHHGSMVRGLLSCSSPHSLKLVNPISINPISMAPALPLVFSGSLLNLTACMHTSLLEQGPESQSPTGA